MPDAARPRRFRHLRRGPRAVREEIDEEIRVHLQMRVDELLADGWPLDEARREALRRFGNLEAARRYCRHQDQQKENAMQRRLLLHELVQDVRVSIRTLLRVPVLTATVLATVGLGIGATTAIVGAIHAVLLRPLPYDEPDRLVWIYTDAPPFEFRFSVADYLALEAQRTRFARIAGFTSRTMTFSDGRSAELLQGRVVTWPYFATLGLRPALGRDFVERDATPGNPPAVIVGHGFWQQRLGARPDAVGTPIKLDGADHVLVGVLPATAGPLERAQEFFVAAQLGTPPRRGPFPYWMIGRLRPGVTHSAAASELREINRRIFPIWRSSYQDERATWNLVDLKTRLVGETGTAAGLALGAVALLWLIACVNASNLLIARVMSRRRELAVRAALGASRGRVVGHVIVESSVLAAGAAAVGVALAWWGIALLRGFGATYFPRTQEIAFDGTVLAVLGVVTLLSVAIFGIVPALHGSGGPVDECLRGGRSSTGSPAIRRLRHALVGAQFAISTPLLVAAALLVVSLYQLRQVDLGFDGRAIVTGSVRLPGALYDEPGKVTTYWDLLTRNLEGVPGVSGVAFADSRPPNTAFNINNFDLEDAPAEAGESQPATPWVAVTPEYFRVLGLTLVEGRLLEVRDAQAPTLESVVVDRAWAARFFKGESAVGKRFREGGCTECPWTTVVGVVSTVKYTGLEQPDEGTVYWPMAGGLSRFLVIKAQGDPRSVIPSVRQVVRNVDPTVPLTSIATIDELVGQSLDTPRSLSLLIASFALVAIALASIGIYGIMTQFVQQQTKDIGIRLALGGTASDILRPVVGRGMTVALAGVLAGLAAAYASTRLMSSLLFGVSAGNALTYVTVGLLLLTVALAACLLPARRALGLQPAAALRDE